MPLPRLLGERPGYKNNKVCSLFQLAQNILSETFSFAFQKANICLPFGFRFKLKLFRRFVIANSVQGNQKLTCGWGSDHNNSHIKPFGKKKLRKYEMNKYQIIETNYIYNK